MIDADDCLQSPLPERDSTGSQDTLVLCRRGYRFPSHSA
jgi:hypothetical protein